MPAVPVPAIISGRIKRRLRKAGAVGSDNAKTLAELDMEKWPFTAPGAKRVLEVMQKRGIIQSDGYKYYLVK